MDADEDAGAAGVFGVVVVCEDGVDGACLDNVAVGVGFEVVVAVLVEEATGACV